MDVFEFIRAFAHATGSTESDTAILEKLQSADRFIFSALKGFENPEFASHMRVTQNDVISVARPYVVADSTINLPCVFVDELVCKLISFGAAEGIDRFQNQRPAAAVVGNTAHIYPKLPWKSGTKEVKLVYSRNPRPMYLYGGFNGYLDKNNEYGIKGKDNLRAFVLTFPTTKPTVAANELRGAILSTQTDANYWNEYDIVENAAGALSLVYVDFVNVRRKERVDMNFASQSGDNADVMGWIHRTSDLPLQYHQAVLDEAIRRTMPVKETK